MSKLPQRYDIADVWVVHYVTLARNNALGGLATPTDFITSPPMFCVGFLSVTGTELETKKAAESIPIHPKLPTALMGVG